MAVETAMGTCSADGCPDRSPSRPAGPDFRESGSRWTCIKLVFY